MRMLAWIGREPNSFVKSAPRFRIPVPASRIRISLPARTSIHEVLPPYWAVIGPGEGVEPRTPRNRILIEGKSDWDVIGFETSCAHQGKIDPKGCAFIAARNSDCAVVGLDDRFA